MCVPVCVCVSEGVCERSSIGSSITQMTGCLNADDTNGQLQASFGLSEGQMLNLPTECNKRLSTYKTFKSEFAFFCAHLPLAFLL